MAKAVDLRLPIRGSKIDPPTPPAERRDHSGGAVDLFFGGWSLMEIRFKRKLSTNKFGYTYIAVPEEIVKALACKYVELIVRDDHVAMLPSE
jgi:hypothetical protein